MPGSGTHVRGDRLPEPVQYRFTRADMWHLARLIYRPTWKRRLAALAALSSIFVVTLAVSLDRWPTATQWAVVARDPLVIGGGLGIIALALGSHYLSIVFFAARYRHFAIADKLVTIGFRPDGIDVDAAGTESRLPWTVFVERVEAPDRVFLKIGTYEAFTIPRRAFPDDEAYRSALALLTSKVPHGPS